ncbi:MAG: ATP-binding protein [Candidatus Methanofastidiosia archaeon]|jgi:MinD superfamily P-loop ATPase
MKEIAIISGKGGTGKTTITAAFAVLCDAVIVDCDVDAANLSLILTPDIKKTEDFYGSKMAVKNDELCTMCGECRNVCRFHGIDTNFDIIPAKCEGCGTCTLVCPVNALSLEPQVTGTVFISTTRAGPFVHAELLMGEEASGKLVTKVREQGQELGEQYNKDIMLIDGSPGIGCPVIASIVGTTLVVIVTEPTLSGIYDLERISQVVDHFDIPYCVCINKCDINTENTKKIETWCINQGVPVIGELPYDTQVTHTMVQGKALTEVDTSLSEKVKKMWEKIQEML